MQNLETIKQLTNYNLWANNEFLRYFRSASVSQSDKALQVFGHLLLAEKIWLTRLTNENTDNTGANFWVVESVDDRAALYDGNCADYEKFIGNLSDENLVEIFTYKNSQGKKFENTVGEALTHVFFHSMYHRGQAAQAIRLAEGKPPATDFIVFLRQFE